MRAGVSEWYIVRPSGLHASPFQGFSVEFSEHRKYTSGDNIADIDWNVYAKTDRFYIKKFQAETNLTGYLVMDLSASMAWTYRQELTKFDYAICLEGELCLELDNGAEVTLTPGTCVVQLGTRHRWENKSDRPALMCYVQIGAVRV